MLAALQPHSANPPSTLTSLEARIERSGERIHLTYELVADLSALIIPAAAAPERTDELWKSTCFELFLRPPGSTAYLEFNFSPSTQWAAYSFTDTREGMAPHADVSPQINCTRDGDRLVLTASLDRVPKILSNQALSANLTAVVEETSGAKSYWAVHHPTDKPDFHHPDSFVLDLPPE